MERCTTCNKKSIFLFHCKCEKRFCEKHKQPEDHSCSFDFLADYRKKLERENIRISVAKLTEI
jgi:predicted nucleic acid binding AN1-type Zn finger protein